MVRGKGVVRMVGEREVECESAGEGAWSQAEAEVGEVGEGWGRGGGHKKQDEKSSRGRREETHLLLLRLVPIHRVRAITALHPAVVIAVQLVVHMTLLVAVPIRVRMGVLHVHGRRLSLHGRGHGRRPIRVLCAPVICRSRQLELEPGPVVRRQRGVDLLCLLSPPYRYVDVHWGVISLRREQGLLRLDGAAPRQVVVREEFLAVLLLLLLLLRVVVPMAKVKRIVKRRADRIGGELAAACAKVGVCRRHRRRGLRRHGLQAEEEE
ncbi:hypothetical protein B0H13DRAFT_2091789 [Mycena leptocephala]|nr:hypothetical protein B0H13DRAFT_2091789 [Mycena leptocephala]